MVTIMARPYAAVRAADLMGWGRRESPGSGGAGHSPVRLGGIQILILSNFITTSFGPGVSAASITSTQAYINALG